LVGFGVLRYRYALSNEGERRCAKDEFYLQQTPKYKGYTEKIFRTLYSSKPLTIRDISDYTGIDKRAVNGIITFNLMAGYIRRIVI
jgi:DNA-binding MarR family transcriptional regulator